MQREKSLEISFLVVVLVSTIIVGCSGMRRRYEAEPVGAVKKVAVAGFEIVQPVPPDLVKILFGPPKDKGPGMMSGINYEGMMAKPSKHAADLEADAAKAMAKLQRWTVLDAPSMRQNAVYREFFKEWMGPIQSRTPVMDGESKFHAPEILDYDSIQRMGQADREKLMNGLGVDGLIAIKIQTRIHAATVMGVGNRYPQAIVMFQLYRKGTTDPIWYDVNAEGEQSKESMGVTRLTADFDKMNQLIATSARTAYKQLLENTKLGK